MEIKIADSTLDARIDQTIVGGYRRIVSARLLSLSQISVARGIHRVQRIFLKPSTFESNGAQWRRRGRRFHSGRRVAGGTSKNAIAGFCAWPARSSATTAQGCEIPDAELAAHNFPMFGETRPGGRCDTGLGLPGGHFCIFENAGNHLTMMLLQRRSARGRCRRKMVTWCRRATTTPRVTIDDEQRSFYCDGLLVVALICGPRLWDFCNVPVFFTAATVQGRFSVPMSRIYNKGKWARTTEQRFARCERSQKVVLGCRR